MIGQDLNVQMIHLAAADFINFPIYVGNLDYTQRMKPETLIFDLDDTLYPPDSGVWQRIGERINLYMHTKVNIPLAEVTRIREAYFHEYGTTLRGLQILHHVDALDYLSFVHDIPLQEYLKPNPILRSRLASLPQNKVIFTNADRAHAERVIDALDLGGIFEQIIDIIAIHPYCKPQPEAFQIALQKLGIADPSRCVIFEDSARNLRTARSLGLITVFVGSNGQFSGAHLRISSLDELMKIFKPDFSLTIRGEE